MRHRSLDQGIWLTSLLAELQHEKKGAFFLFKGHYISDVYDIKKQSWFTYNDLEVSRTLEATVQCDRDRSGYIFFYMHK